MRRVSARHYARAGALRIRRNGLLCSSSSGMDQPHTVKRGGSVYYYLADGPGNVVGLLDASGTLVNEYHYSAWGEAEVEREEVAQPYHFTGREWDAEAGLYQYRARWYDPELGRFLSEDPIGLAGGINGYAYAENDPVNHNDPSGLTCLKRATGGQCLLWDLEGISNLPQPVGWQGRIYQRNWLFGALTDLHDPDDEAAYLQQLQQAEADARKRELLGEAIRSVPGAADLAVGFTPGVSTAADAYTLATGRNLITGEAVGVGGRFIAFVGMITPLSGGSIRGAGTLLGQGFGNVHGGSATVEAVLDQAETWLGPGYREITSGIFRSADNARQFRMRNVDLLDRRNGPHVHFEAIGPNGRDIIENSHVDLWNR